MCGYIICVGVGAGLLFSSGCALLSSRQDLAEAIAAKGHLRPVIFHSNSFDIAGYQRLSAPQGVVTVYLEGDGAAWQNRYHLALDPTPKNPVALRLASKDPGDNIVYLARPCQYISSSACNASYWSSHRYSPIIMQVISRAIDQVKNKARAEGIILVGYSGGGTMAALLAAHRHDVRQLVTVAANLDTSYWVRIHGVTPLYGSLNPVQFADTLQEIPQIHFVGADDQNVPPVVCASYLAALPDKQHARMWVIPNMGHQADWDKIWPGVWAKARKSSRGTGGLKK